MTSDEPTTHDPSVETAADVSPPDRIDEAADQSSEMPPWRPVIRPYLSTLAKKISDQNPEGHSISIPIGRFSILVTPLDQDLAVKAIADQDLDEPHHYLICDAVGMEILIAVAQRKHERAGTADKPRAADRIEKGLDYGYRLSHLMTVEMRQLRNDGLVDAAGEVQDARRRLSSIINDAEKTIQKPEDPPQPSEESESEEQAPQRFVYQWDSSGPGSDSGRIPVQASHVRRSTQPPKKTTGRQILLLAFLVAVLGLVLTHLWLNRPRQLQDFSVEDFPGVPGIEQVINRSPVILIIVSENQWAGTDRFDKEQAVASVGEIVGPAGYKLAEFRSAISSTLASWTSGGKIVIAK